MSVTRSSRENRLNELASAAGLTAKDVSELFQGLNLEQGSRMVENAVALGGLPLAIATDFVLNGRELLVPMAIASPAVAAACSAVARLVRPMGGFIAASSEPIMIGQLQILNLPDVDAAVSRITAASPELMQWLNSENPATVSRHARAVGIEVRRLQLGEYALAPEPEHITNASVQRLASEMVVVHLLYDCGDAMGANLVNTACEALAPRLELLTGGRVNLRVLSNLADRRLAWARCSIDSMTLAALESSPRHGEVHGRSPAERIASAFHVAEVDAEFAATANRAVMTGVDAVVIATGNDWRAIEAGGHAFAARSGRYLPLARWQLNARGDLMGEIELPVAAGIIGGATRIHPTAKAVLKILGVQSAQELAQVIACAGLASHFAQLWSPDTRWRPFHE